MENQRGAAASIASVHSPCKNQKQRVRAKRYPWVTWLFKKPRHSPSASRLELKEAITILGTDRRNAVTFGVTQDAPWPGSVTVSALCVTLSLSFWTYVTGRLCPAMAFAVPLWTSWADPRWDLLHPGPMVPGLPADPVTTSSLAQLRAGRSPLSEPQTCTGVTCLAPSWSSPICAAFQWDGFCSPQATTHSYGTTRAVDMEQTQKKIISFSVWPNCISSLWPCSWSWSRAITVLES